MIIVSIVLGDSSSDRDLPNGGKENLTEHGSSLLRSLVVFITFTLSARRIFCENTS